jgi:hypothetical protein
MIVMRLQRDPRFPAYHRGARAAAPTIPRPPSRLRHVFAISRYQPPRRDGYARSQSNRRDDGYLCACTTRSSKTRVRRDESLVQRRRQQGVSRAAILATKESSISPAFATVDVVIPILRRENTAAHDTYRRRLRGPSDSVRPARSVGICHNKAHHQCYGISRKTDDDIRGNSGTQNGGRAVIFTEDLQQGYRFGVFEVVNPFREPLLREAKTRCAFTATGSQKYERPAEAGLVHVGVQSQLSFRGTVEKVIVGPYSSGSSKINRTSKAFRGNRC